MVVPRILRPLQKTTGRALMPVLLSAACIGLLAAALIAGSLRFLSSEWQWHALEVRGVEAQATILSYSYDPTGGDPNGWTSERIRFQPSPQETLFAKVGHHGPTLGLGKRVVVVYDRDDPKVVRLASTLEGHGDEYAVTQWVGITGIVFGALAAIGCLLLLALAVCRTRFRPRSPAKGAPSGIGS